MKLQLGCLLVALIVPVVLHAEEPPIKWKPIGPGGGGWLTALAVDCSDSNLAYLGCDVGGFYKSTNGGRNWTIMNEGLTDYYVQDILPDPERKDIIYLGMFGGLFKSTDGGETWQWKRTGFPEPSAYSYSAPVSSLVMHPTDRQILYAGIGRPRMNSDGKGHIYRSTDAGKTWHLLDGIAKYASDAVIHRLAVRPDNPNVLFAATDKGLFKSSDGGVTFQRREEGLPHRFCRNVAVSPSKPNVMYVVMWSTHAKEPWHGGVYRSDDGGDTWVARNTELPQMVAPTTRPSACTCNYVRFLIDPRDPDRIFVGANSWWGAGLYRSTDGGRRWDKITYMRDEKKNMDLGWITFGGTSVKCIAFAPSKPDIIFYGTSMRLMKTNDGGDHWRQCHTAQRPDGTWQTNGAETTCISRITVDRTDSRRIYAGYADIGLMVSDNGGETWSRSVNGLKRHGDLAEVVVDPADPKVLWCKDGKWQGTCHVAQSRDRGNTWKTISGPESGLPDSVLFDLLLDPNSPVASRTLYVVSVPHGVFKSTTGGRTWKRASNGLPDAPLRISALTMDPTKTGTLYAAVYGNASSPQGGIFRSRDAGATWHRINAGVVFSGVQHMCVSPHDSQILFVAARSLGTHPNRQQGGVYRSLDGGTSWDLLKKDRFASCVVVSANNPRCVFASFHRHPYHDNCTGTGVWVSNDLGQTWRTANDGLTTLRISGITLDPNDPTRIYAGSGGNGLFVGKMSYISSRLPDHR